MTGDAVSDPSRFRCERVETHPPHIWGPCKTSFAFDGSAYCDGQGERGREAMR